MAKKNRAKRKRAGMTMVAVIIAIVGSVMAWSFFNLINMALEDTMKLFAIDNPYYSNSIIIIGGVLILLIIGKKREYIMNRLMNI